MWINTCLKCAKSIINKARKKNSYDRKILNYIIVGNSVTSLQLCLHNTSNIYMYAMHMCSRELNDKAIYTITVFSNYLIISDNIVFVHNYVHNK